MSKQTGTLTNLELEAEAQELIALYKDNAADMLDREKAVMESEIWNSLSPVTRGEWRRGYFMRAVFGGTVSEYDLRASIFSAGPAGEELWPRILNEGMTLRTASNILAEARKAFANDVNMPSVKDAILVELREYDKLPHIRKLPGGKIVRQKPPNGTPSRKQASSPPSSKRNGKPKRKSPTAPKEVYQQIREIVSQHIARQLEGLDEATADQIYSDFEIDLKLSIESLRERIHHQKKNQQKLQTLSAGTLRKHARDAFDELGMEIPKPSALIDLNVVKRRYRKLAKVYHPDRHPSDPDISESLSRKFHAITEAYHYICSYAEHQQKERNESRG